MTKLPDDFLRRLAFGLEKGSNEGSALAKAQNMAMTLLFSVGFKTEVEMNKDEIMEFISGLEFDEQQATQLIRVALVMAVNLASEEEAPWLLDGQKGQ